MFENTFIGKLFPSCRTDLPQRIARFAARGWASVSIEDRTGRLSSILPSQGAQPEGREEWIFDVVGDRIRILISRFASGVANEAGQAGGARILFEELLRSHEQSPDREFSLPKLAARLDHRYDEQGVYIDTVIHLTCLDRIAWDATPEPMMRYEQLPAHVEVRDYRMETLQFMPKVDEMIRWGDVDSFDIVVHQTGETWGYFKTKEF